MLHELRNHLRLRILGTQETSEKSQIWVETQPSAQYSLQKSNFDNGSQKANIKVFQSLSILLGFFTLLQIFYPGLYAGYTSTMSQRFKRIGKYIINPLSSAERRKGVGVSLITLPPSSKKKGVSDFSYKKFGVGEIGGIFN